MNGPFTTITVTQWARMTERIRKLEDVAKEAEKVLEKDDMGWGDALRIAIESWKAFDSRV
jgi:hypothetical protein